MDAVNQDNEKAVLLDNIYTQMTDTFYERQHGHYLVRKTTVSGADVDELMNLIEEFLGIPKS